MVLYRKDTRRQKYDPRLGNLPDNWTARCLRDCIIENPIYGANSSAVPYDKQLPRYIRITDLDGNGKLRGTTKVSIGQSGNEKYILKEGDFLFARTGATVGKTLLYKKNYGFAIYAGYLIRFRLNKEILLPEYLSYYAQSRSYWSWVKSIIRTGAQPNINAKEYSALNIPLPPLPEQRKIVSILSTWDRAIELTGQLIAAKERIKESLIRFMLTGLRRFPEFEKYDDGKYSSSSIPPNWRLLKAYQFITLNKDKFDPRGPSSLMPCIELEHISQRTGKLLGYIQSNEQLSLKNRFLKGQVLFGKLRPYLQKYLHPDFNGVCSTEIWVISGKEETCTNSYLFYLVQTQRFMAAANITSGTKMPRADWNYVREISFILPPINEQNKITDLLENCSKEIQLLEDRLLALIQQKKWLMQQLLTGKIRVNVETK